MIVTEIMLGPANGILFRTNHFVPREWVHFLSTPPTRQSTPPEYSLDDFINRQSVSEGMEEHILIILTHFAD